MTSFATGWQWLRGALRERDAELRLCLRVTIAATLSLAVSHLLNLPLALWTVLTAVILTQMSVGRSLKALWTISSPPAARLCRRSGGAHPARQ